MSESDLDRNHAATPYKLEKARDRGQVAKSPDVIGAVVFTTAMVFLAWQGWAVWQRVFQLARTLLGQADRVLSDPTLLWTMSGQMLQQALLMAVPFFATLVIAAIVANMMQSGPILTLHPVKPDWQRLNPVTGFKRLLSVRTLFVAARSMLKLLVLGLVAWLALKHLLPQFYRLSDLPAGALMRTLLDDFAALGLKFAGALVLIALLDLLYSRHEFAKKMRMSQREIKDEAKNRDGDPRIRARLRELRREMLKRSLAVRNTRHADVLITNPTHVAVALRYVHGEMTSPQLVAKGRGFMAAVMRQVAARHRIPVVRSPALARQLYRDLAIDQQVRPDLYARVARIIVWVLARRDARAGGAAAAPGGEATWTP
jgi:flagellar biosynthetic protein FlhB